MEVAMIKVMKKSWTRSWKSHEFPNHRSNRHPDKLYTKIDFITPKICENIIVLNWKLLNENLKIIVDKRRELWDKCKENFEKCFTF